MQRGNERGRVRGATGILGSRATGPQDVGARVYLTTNAIPPRRRAKRWKFCDFIMVSTRKHQKHGKASLQSAFHIAQCCRRFVMLRTSLTPASSEDPHDEVERQGQSPRSTHEDDGNQLILQSDHLYLF